MSNAFQQQNFLLTGKLTGKIAKLGLTQATRQSLNAAATGFLAKFPMKTNRK
jgi:hypothetical protein